MIPISDLLLFMLAALAMVLTPGPNMMYLISRSLIQGKKAGVISLAGVICGFSFHIVMVAFGLTAVLFTIPYAFVILKSAGVLYLLYIAYNAIKPGSKGVFQTRQELKIDGPYKLFMMGFLTNVLNPKMAVFYLSLFPQFIQPEAGNITLQCFLLGTIQMTISFAINYLIITGAAKAAGWFARNPLWIKVQKWVMASVLTFLAVKMALSKAK